MEHFFGEFQNTWLKIAEGIYQTLWFKWVFELWELELKEPWCDSLIGNSDGINEFVRPR